MRTISGVIQLARKWGRQGSKSRAGGLGGRLVQNRDVGDIDGHPGDTQAADDRGPGKGTVHVGGEGIRGGQGDKGDPLGPARHRMVFLPGADGLAKACVFAQPGVPTFGRAREFPEVP